MRVIIEIRDWQESNGMIEANFIMLRFGVKRLLKEHAVGICYDLISGTLPMAGGVDSGGTLAAYEKGIGNFRRSVDAAFKPIQNIQFGTLAMNRDWESLKVYGYKFNNPRYQQWLDNGKWDSIRGIFERSGFNEDNTLEVIDEANITQLHDWRMMKKTNPYYVRNPQSIEKLRRANRQVKVGFMAGGWLKAAKNLGMVCDRHTVDRRGIAWMKWGNGYATVSNEGNTVTVINEYANYGNWMFSQVAKFHLQNRYDKINKDFTTLLINFGEIK